MSRALDHDLDKLEAALQPVSNPVDILLAGMSNDDLCRVLAMLAEIEAKEAAGALSNAAKPKRGRQKRLAPVETKPTDRLADPAWWAALAAASDQLEDEPQPPTWQTLAAAAAEDEDS